MRASFAVTLLLTLSSVACAPSGSRSAPLENTYWRLVEVDGRPAIGVEGEREAHLRFVQDSARVVGSTGCNRLTGPFTREGATLRFGAAATTRMACVDSLLNRQEQAFLAARQATDRHEISGDTLTLIGGATPRARLTATSR